MASTTLPVVKRPGKPRSKRFVQPVVPVLPQVSAARKNSELGAHQADKVPNGDVQEAPGEESRRASTTASLSLPNGVHTYGIPELSGDSAASEDIRSSPVANSPPSQPVSAAAFPSSEPQVVPSILPEQTEPSSASPSPPEATNIEGDQPSIPAATTNGFNFASKLSQPRSSRTRDRQILFHAPLESPSPPRATQRSLSVPSVSTPPPDLSPLHVVSAMPEIGMFGSQEEQTSTKTQPEMQELEVVEVTDQPPSCSPPESQPQSTIGPVRPDSSPRSAEFGGLHDAGSMFQPGGEPVTQNRNGRSDNSHPLPMNDLLNGNQLNGHARGDPNIVRSMSSEQSGIEEDSLPPLSAHLTRLFTNKEWVDWSIEISSPEPSLHSIAYMAHGVLMARSPTLRQGMGRHLLSNRMDRVIVLSPDRYIQPAAFEAALRYLYTESLLTKPEIEEMLSSNGGGRERLTREHQLDIALSYWMAGLVLGLRLVAQQAVKLVLDIIDWDVLEFMFQQALTLGEHTLNMTVELSKSNEVTPGSSPTRGGSAASPQRMSPNPFSPSLDCFGPSEFQDGTANYHYSAINATMSEKMKRIVLEFLSQHINTSVFEMEDPPNTILKSYLPATREYSTSSRHRANPALAAIRFGAMPLAEEETLPARPLTMPRSSEHVTSAILLNLRYSDLTELCLLIQKHTPAMEPASATLATQSTSSPTDDTAGSTSDHVVHRFDDNLYSWIQKVVAEREKRRRKVLKSKTVSNQERQFKQQTWNVVGWEEYAHKTDEGWELRKSWKGSNLPGPVVVSSS